MADEARLLNKRHLDLELLEVFTGEREGSEAEQARLHRIAGQLREGIYSQAVYVLTHTTIENPTDAKRVLQDIIRHRNSIVKGLGRHVSIQVAALDYMQNVRNILKKPTIIESDRYQEFVQKALLDQATSTYDKDMLDAGIDAEIEKAQRLNTAFSILFLDIDNLKQINDTSGHEAGTKAIKFVSKCIKRNLRKYDTVYRYGGDEFVVVLPGADEKRAYETARRIQRLLETEPLKALDQNPGVSIGVAAYSKDVTPDRKTLLSAADTALYEAKGQGKGRITVFSPRHEDVPPGDDAGDSHPASTAAPPDGGHRIIKGQPLVPGFGVGKALQYRDIATRQVEVRDLKPEEVEEEQERISRAVAKVRDELRQMKESLAQHIGSNDARIFEVHHSILEDAELQRRIERELLDSKVNAEQVVRNVFAQLERTFRESESHLLRERAHDIHDVGLRMLRVLTGSQESILADIAPNTVIFSKRLLPSDTIHFTKRKPMAIVTEEGGPNAHSALIAKARGIPSISNASFTPRKVPDGTEVIVDGYTGEIIVNPTPDEKATFRAKRATARQSKRNVVKQIKHRTLRTRKQEPITVSANVASAEEVETAVRLGADGIGLYRLEPVYMLAKSIPDENHLYRELCDSLKHAANLPVVLRLADLGGDKTLPYLNLGHEHSSLLGLRGIRLLLKHTGLLRTQLRVFLRLAVHHDLKILVPMVTTPGDMRTVRTMLREEEDQLRQRNVEFKADVPLGAMLETPSAAMQVDAVMEHCDFLSIGSNDLIQYLTAADRESSSVSRYYEYGRKLALKMTGEVVKKARHRGMYCSLCGELAGNTDYTRELLEARIKNFSVSSPLVPTLKDYIHRLTTEKRKKRRGTAQ